MKKITYWKDVCNFICLVIHNFNMWERRSHTLEPLTHLTYSKVNFKNTYANQKEFEEIYRIVDCGTLLAYTNFN